MYVPRAMYSLRMSFWMVPDSRSAPDAALLGNHDVHRQEGGGRGIDRHRRRHRLERESVEQDMHVVDGIDGDPDTPDLTESPRRIGVDPHLRRQVEGDAEARLARLEQVAEAGIGLGRGAEARVLAHRPEAAAVHRRLDAAGERERPRRA